MNRLNNKGGIIIPVYNHGDTISSVIEDAKGLKLPIVVVDDGSTDHTYKNISRIKGITILRHDVNQGKGAAIMTGFKALKDLSSWAITLDADGQHNPLDAHGLIQSIPENGMCPIIIGNRLGMGHCNVPWTSRFGRKFSNFWIRLSGGPLVNDSQSGFRIYPLPEVLDLDVIAKRYQFEVEILVKASWKGIPVVETPISVIYLSKEERVSHFRPFVDFWRNTMTFSRLIPRNLIQSILK